MAETTKISWADHTGNPWVGCTVAHTGCLNCYARDFSQRKHGSHGAKASRPWALWGPHQDRYVTKGFWTDAPKWARAAARDGVRRTIFPSLMDPLDAEVYQRSEAPEGVACRATFDRFMQTIRETGQIGLHWPNGEKIGTGGLTWLLLTKRPENWRWIPEDVRRFCWLLYSASDQETLDAGMPHLLAAEGFAGLGLSLEPLVGPVRLFHIARREAFWSKLRWVVCGGESGRNARPCDVAWIRAIVRQCREAGVSQYVKQMGANPTADLRNNNGNGPAAFPISYVHAAGADPSEWPADLRVQEFPEGLR